MDIYAELVKICGSYFPFTGKLFVSRVMIAGLGKTKESFGLSDLVGFIDKVGEFTDKSLTPLEIEYLKKDLMNLQKKLAASGRSFTVISSIHSSDLSNISETDMLRGFLSLSYETMSSLERTLNESSLFVVTDLAGDITYVNERFIGVTKYPREELIGQNNKILKSGFHTSGFFDDLWQIISGGNVSRADLRNKTKEGSIYWVRSVFIPLFDVAHKITGYSAVEIQMTDLMNPIEELYLRQQKGDTLSIADQDKLFSYQHGKVNT